MRHSLPLCTLAIALALTAPAVAAEQCQLQRIASYDMTLDTVGRGVIPFSVGGQTLSLLVDTGGMESVMTEGAAARLGLKADTIPQAVFMKYYGGHPIEKFTKAPDVTIGNLKSKRDLTFLVIPDAYMDPGIDGTLSPDLLLGFDVDFDYANAKFNLFSRDHCEGRVVYWTAPSQAAAVPFRINEGGQIDIDVTLDGKTVPAAIDTGAYLTIMDLSTAESLFGFDEKDPSLKHRGEHSYHRRFQSLALGGVTVNNPDLVLNPVSVSHDGGPEKLIVGADILRRLHLYIAYGEKTLYLTPATAH